MTNPDALKKLSTARAQLLLNKGQGFWGVLALRLNLVERPECKTLAVDGKNVFYNPEFVLGLTDSLCRSAMAHEVMHCVLDHMRRRGSRNPKKWNHAGDYAINLILEEGGFEIGKGWLLHKNYAGMSADEIYNMLPDDDGNDDDGDQALDEILDAANATDADAVEWQIAAVQAATQAKNHGKLPASIERLVEEITEQKVDWRSALRAFMTERAKDDYSWARPNRRYLAAGMYLPGMYSEAMGEVAIGIDTSGSIDQHTLNTFGSEIKAIVDTAKPVLTRVIYCDAEVNHVDEFTPEQELTFKMHGGGGTDFCPPFELIDEKGWKPACMVYLTDGYGPFPPEPPYPTLWVCTTDVVAPFGRTIPIQL
jgi:predicted metal-dependent peptidase